MRTRWIAALSTAVVAAAVAFGSWASASPPAGPGRTVDPGNFTSPLANPYYPIVPGTVSIYKGTEGKDHLRERLSVTSSTRVILGVTTTVIHDVLYANGLLAEKTVDWYADDNAGNVWYFGEDTALYDEHGHVTSTEGTWQAGVRSAEAGIIMPADPKPTDAHRQEFLKGHAEDQAWIVQRNATADVAYGHMDHVVRSFEWTVLEPNVLSLKLYAPGLGIVRELDVAGGNESLQLVAVKTV